MNNLSLLFGFYIFEVNGSTANSACKMCYFVLLLQCCKVQLVSLVVEFKAVNLSWIVQKFHFQNVLVRRLFVLNKTDRLHTKLNIAVECEFVLHAWVTYAFSFLMIQMI